MDDFTKEKIKDLIALRNNYFSMIIVISTGIASLFILNLDNIKFIAYLIVLAYFGSVFILKFEFTSNQINKLLKEKE